MTKKWLPGILAALFLLAGLGMLALVFVPFDGLKSLTGSLMPDGEFETLKEDNLVVFRGIFLAVFLVSGVLAYLFTFQRWGVVGAFLKQLWADTRSFFAGLRPQKGDLWFWA
ncbi:hypothetical protein EG834_14585, partial [bacterium]|nr:hypothetical protein [bacterium]